MKNNIATQPFNVRIPIDLLARMRNASDRHRRTLTSFVIAGVEKELDELDDHAPYKNGGGPHHRAAVSTS